MLILMLFAFLAGFATVISPCVLPVLPAILSVSAGKGKLRPYGVILGLIISFVFFTLALTTLVQSFGISASVLRYSAILIIGFFGLVLFLPTFSDLFARAASRIADFGNNLQSQTKTESSGFWSGILLGAALGLIWTPCAGPILAAITALVATQKVTGEIILLTLAYSVGSALPLLVITLMGSKALTSYPFFIKNSERIRQGFGVVMILTALALAFNWDVIFQQKVLEYLPSIQIENNSWVQSRLKKLRTSNPNFPTLGPGVFDTMPSDENQPTEDRPPVMNPQPQEILQPLETKQPTDMKQAVETEQSIKGKQPLNDKPSSDEKKAPLVLLPKIASAPNFVGIAEWINSKPLTMDELKGKVVLIDFWTYSCINCIRTLPYLKEWYQKYDDKGLVIVGVHTPEFEFEKKLTNVQEAVKRFGIIYPVALDNDYGTWQAYNNSYWPAHYLVDQKGIVRQFHFGEGGYLETENAIRSLLNLPPIQETSAVQTDTNYSLLTPETYLGAKRARSYIPENKIKLNEVSTYFYSGQVGKDQVGLKGQWLAKDEFIQSASNKSQLTLNFMANRVYLVMGGQSSLPLKIEIDGKPIPAKNKTADMNADGEIFVKEPRKYDIVDMNQVGGRHQVTLSIPEGIEVYAFTFGMEGS